MAKYERDRHLVPAEVLDLLGDLVFSYREFFPLQVHYRLVRGIDNCNVEQHQVGANRYRSVIFLGASSSLGCCGFWSLGLSGRC